MAATPSWPTLKYGQSGPNVRALQCLINAHMSKITVTGTFDQATRQAVANFQRQNKLPVTEEANEAVLSKMVGTVRQVDDLSTSPMSQAAQFLLNKFESISVDGNFGSGSATALATFQVKMKLPLVGIVDRLTWQYLFGYNSYPSGCFVPHPSTSVYASVCVLTSTLTDTQTTKNAQYICNWLMKQQGFTKNAACGVLGNMQSESGINPGIWEILARTNLGYGLVQWTPATKFLNWAVNNRILSSADTQSVNDLAVYQPEDLMDAELEFLIYSCTTSGDFYAPKPGGSMDHTGYYLTYAEYKKSTLDAGLLAKIFHDHYERSKKASSLPERAANANYWYKQL